MSYYESYLFEKRAGLLDDRELRAVSALSSHIETSRAHAFVTYHYGSFKYKPLEVLEKYFDTFRFYIPMCGGKLAYRFSPDSVDVEKLKSYRVEDSIMVHEINGWIILEVSLFQDEPDYEREVEDFEDSRNPFSEFWNDTIDRDYRWLEILWVYAMNQSRTATGKETIQPTLRSDKLSQRHHLLADFFMESPDVITTIDELTYRDEVYGFNPDEWLDGLSRNEMMRIIQDLIDEPLRAQQKLLSQIRQTYDDCGEPNKQSRPITFTDLQKLISITRRQRENTENQQLEDDASQFSKKILHLEPALWDRIHTLIEEKKAARYDLAIRIMQGIHFAYQFHSKESHFIKRTQQIHERYSRCSSLSEKMTDTHLLKPYSDPLFLQHQSPDWSVFDL